MEVRLNLSATMCALAGGILWTTASWAAFPAASSPAQAAAVVSVATGPPFVLIRGDVLYAATRGVTVSPGDLIESGSGGLLVLEFREGESIGATVEMGPATRIFWRNRPDGTALALLAGWIKVDTTSSSQGLVFGSEGPRLGATSGAGTYVAHVAADRDELFHESGALRFWTNDSAGTASGAVVSSRPSELVVRVGAAPPESRIGPGSDFVRRLPPEFLDPVPLGIAAKLPDASEPQRLRAVAYEDVEAWLTAPRDWRRGFVARFRPRLKDRSFRRALAAHLRAHPEWAPVLHPAPAPHQPGEPMRGER